MKRFVLIVYCMLTIHVSMQAQSYSSVHYDTKDGLPSATVYAITQDKDGFIWFGTENGLSRFDGKNFKTFTTKDGLPDNSILSVHGDNNGRVYFTPFTHGIYYYEKGYFHKMQIPEKYRLDITVVEKFYNKKNLVIFGALDKWYVLENDSLISFDGKYSLLPPAWPQKILDTLIVALSGDSLSYMPDSGNNWAIARPWYDLPMLFDERGQLKRINAVSVYEDYISGNFVYNHTDQFLNIFDLTDLGVVHKIRMEKFSRAFIDNEKNLWVSTLGNGVFRFPSFEFRNIAFDQKSEIFSIAKVNDQLIAGTDFSKMYQLTLKGNSPEYLVTDFFNLIAKSGNTVAHISKRNRIYVLRTAGDNIYIGADAFLLKKNKSSAPVFRNIFPVKDIDITGNKILVCTGHAALLLGDESFSIEDTILKQRSTCGVIYHDNYYVGTIGGLIRINSANKKITELNSLFPPFRSRITAIKKGIDDDLWIATSGSGLVHFKNDKIVQTLKEEDGLTSDICTSLFIDNDLVWLGTNNGLNRIETGKEKPGITRLTSANGLGADFINVVIATDSNVYAGTAAGLTIFSKNIQAEKSVCVLHILQVSENNRKLKKDSSYSFPHDALNIRIDFTAISFKSAGDIAYYYQLKGLSQKWDTTTANFINFPTLQPDNYTLYLKAVNKFGVESETKTISITILPPWWQTWLFRIIVLSAIGLLVLVVYRYNINNIKRKEKTKREVESRFAALEQRALQAQMNPHFIFNALNSIQTFILNLDVEGANTYLTSFASLIRQTLENSMHPLITVASEIKYLETYLLLEKLRFRDKFRYDIHVDETIDQNNTVLPGMLLQPYIENSLRHGIQHRKDNNGLISLTANKTIDGSILYTITDNGVGRKKAQELRSSQHIEYQSRGTSINEKRIAAINSQFNTNIRVNTGDIVDENGIVTGTTASVLIPHL